MTAVWVAGGLIVVIVALADAVWTTLWPEGRAGPIASSLGRAVWHLAELVAGKSRHRLLGLAGPAVLLLTVFAWVALVAVGWTMVFTADGALNSTRGPGGGDVFGRLWFVVYTMHTVGNGDFTPATDMAELAASFTAFTGMGLITLSVTYLLSIINAVTTKRAFATMVSGLGDSPENFVIDSWDGERFRGFGSSLSAIASQLNVIEHQRRAYPITQYFHADERSRSSEAALGVLDDGLTLILAGVPEAAHPDPAPVRSVRAGVTSYLRMLESGPVEPADEVPPAPDLTRLAEAGLPTLDSATFQRAVAQLEHRRRLLLAVVRSDDWDWTP